MSTEIYNTVINTDKTRTNVTEAPVIAQTNSPNITHGTTTYTESTTSPKGLSLESTLNYSEGVTSQVGNKETSAFKLTTAAPSATSDEMTTLTSLEVPNFTFATRSPTTAFHSESSTEVSTSLTTPKVTNRANTETYQTNTSQHITDTPNVNEDSTALMSSVTESKLTMSTSLSITDALTTTFDINTILRTNESSTALSLQETTTSPSTNAVSNDITTLFPTAPVMSASATLKAEALSDTSEHSTSISTHSTDNQHEPVTDTALTTQGSSSLTSPLDGIGISVSRPLSTSVELDSSFGTGSASTTRLVSEVTLSEGITVENSENTLSSTLTTHAVIDKSTEISAMTLTSTLTTMKLSSSQTSSPTTIPELISISRTSVEQNTTAPSLTTITEEMTTSSLITAGTITESKTKTSDVTSSEPSTTSAVASVPATSGLPNWTTTASPDTNANTENTTHLLKSVEYTTKNINNSVNSTLNTPSQSEPDHLTGNTLSVSPVSTWTSTASSETAVNIESTTGHLPTSFVYTTTNHNTSEKSTTLTLAHSGPGPQTGNTLSVSPLATWTPTASSETETHIESTTHLPASFVYTTKNLNTSENSTLHASSQSETGPQTGNTLSVSPVPTWTPTASSETAANTESTTGHLPTSFVYTTTNLNTSENSTSYTSAQSEPGSQTGNTFSVSPVATWTSTASSETAANTESTTGHFPTSFVYTTTNLNTSENSTSYTSAQSEPGPQTRNTLSVSPVPTWTPTASSETAANTESTTGHLPTSFVYTTTNLNTSENSTSYTSAQSELGPQTGNTFSVSPVATWTSTASSETAANTESTTGHFPTSFVYTTTNLNTSENSTSYTSAQSEPGPQTENTLSVSPVPTWTPTASSETAANTESTTGHLPTSFVYTTTNLNTSENSTSHTSAQSEPGPQTGNTLSVSPVPTWTPTASSETAANTESTTGHLPTSFVYTTTNLNTSENSTSHTSSQSEQGPQPGNTISVTPSSFYTEKTTYFNTDTEQGAFTTGSVTGLTQPMETTAKIMEHTTASTLTMPTVIQNSTAVSATALSTTNTSALSASQTSSTNVSETPTSAQAMSSREVTSETKGSTSSNAVTTPAYELASVPSSQSSLTSHAETTTTTTVFVSNVTLPGTPNNTVATVTSLQTTIHSNQQPDFNATTLTHLTTANVNVSQLPVTSMSPTTSHSPTTAIPFAHSSSFPQTTTIIPTNLSGSLSTVSTVTSSPEVSSASPTGNATKNLTSTTKPSSSYITHAVPTSHIPATDTLLTTLTTRTTQLHVSDVVTSKPTNSTTANYTVHTLTTTALPTPVMSSTVTIPSTTVTTITTHAPATVTNKTAPVTNILSTVHSQTMSTSTVASTTTALVPVTNATSAPGTILTTLLPTTATSSQFECSLSVETMVKMVLTLTSGTQSDIILQGLSVFLNNTLYQAFKLPVQVYINQTSVNVQTVNMTVGYSASVNSSVYIPSAIVTALTASNIFNFTYLKSLIPALQSVPVVAEPWVPNPAINYKVKTVLKLMATGRNVNTCVYARSMEQKLQTAYEKAGQSSSGGGGSLSVQILSTSKVDPYLSLIYVVTSNGQLLDGITASNLLNKLSGEVVGYYLGDPPSIIAEPLYYPNIDTSGTTIIYWVTTVIQGVDPQLLGVNNQSFARQMEERLATLFQLSGQQSRRFKRATTVGSYTVQMVKMQQLDGSNNPVELTYYADKDGVPILGTAAAKQLSTIDPQTMALTLGYIVRTQANPVVQKPPNNLWIIAAVLAPIAVVTVIIIIITAVLCRKNKSDFKTDSMGNMPPRTKPVQGFDYAKQHLGQQGGDEDVLPVTHETVVPSLNLSQERDSTKDGSTEKMLKSSDTRKSRSPCENGSVISNESEDASSDRSTPQKGMAQHRLTKDEARKWNVPISDEDEGKVHFDKMVADPFDSSSGSVKLVGIKPVSLTMPDRNQKPDTIINGEVNKALKQKSDIEHYRNKLRLKAKRKGYYDFPPLDNKSLNDRKRKMYEKTQMEINNALDAETDTSSPFAEPKNRQPSIKNHPYRSRQSLNSPSPGETEMDLLVTRERPRRGIRNSGYDTEPEMMEETNIDRVKQARTYIKARQAKGHSETSTLSSQPSIDEVRQQMHMLLEEAFSLASAGHGGPKRQADPYASAQHMPYSEVVTSAPGTMSRPRMQWVPTYGPEMYQYSLPRPTYRFSQLPEMVMGSPPPPVPPRTGPVAVPSLRRSTSDVANKNRMPEPGGSEQGPGNSVPAVFAIPGNRGGYSGYYIPQPPAAYRNQAWMSYSGENDLPGQWADAVPLPGYIEAYPRSRYPQNSPSRLPRQFGQPVIHQSLEHAAGPSIGASQQSLADTDTPDASITNLSTAALVKAIREEVAKLAKKQTDMFEFQV
ncbi:UPF0606 protein KIAA1549L homolog isoform X2 [Hyperolius riggenbachi]|uniref:UPF0606 protein KIAA1549L homolog isoform X2 n=1 Tax=Hyperolius riggenbachi TaxID=752182 RepID=UPI0035A26296